MQQITVSRVELYQIKTGFTRVSNGLTEITKQEQDMLRAGLPVRDKLIERNDGRKFVTTLQVNVEQRGVEFVPGTGKSPRTAQTQEAKGDKMCIRDRPCR